MSNSPYPILVEKFRGRQSLTIVCESCHQDGIISDEQINNECLYACPARCGGWATYKYDEGIKCAGCGTLGYYEKPLNYCCSRKCMLQAEYAESLRAAA